MAGHDQTALDPKNRHKTLNFIEFKRTFLLTLAQKVQDGYRECDVVVVRHS